MARGFKIPVISTAILIGQIGIAAARGGGDWKRTANEFQILYTGYDLMASGFHWPRLVEGYGPWLVKGLVMKVARPLGAAPRLPLKGLPISFS